MYLHRSSGADCLPYEKGDKKIIIYLIEKKSQYFDISFRNFFGFLFIKHLLLKYIK